MAKHDQTRAAIYSVYEVIPVIPNVLTIGVGKGNGSMKQTMSKQITGYK
jgi:hypothetical protein